MDEVGILVKLRELRQFQADAQRVQREIAEMAGATAATDKAAAASAASYAKLQKRARGMASVGRSMQRTFTLPVLLAGGAAVSMSLKFDDAMTNIRALVGASAEDMEMFRSRVLELSSSGLPQGPQELAEALYFVTSSGFEGAGALKVLEASAKAAAAGLGDTMVVADLVTSAVNVYGEAALSAGSATDILLATVRLGKGDPEELAGAFSRVIPVAEALGVSFQESGAGLASLTLGGLDAAEAATGLRGIFTSIIKPTKDGRAQLKEFGLSIDDVRKMVAEDGLMPTMMMLRKEIGDDKDALGAIFPNVRALNAFLSLTGANAQKNTAIFKDMADTTGETDKAFKEASKSAGFQLRAAWSKIRVALIELGDVLVPFIATFMEMAVGFINWFKGLPGPVKTAVLAFVAFLAVMGPILIITSKLILAYGVLTKTKLAMAVSSKIAAGAMWLFNAALMGNPIVLVIAGIVALGIGFVILYRKVEWFRNAVNAVWDWIKSHWELLTVILAGPLGAAVVLIVKHWRPIVGFFQNIWSQVKGAFEAAWSVIGPILDKIIGAIETIMDFVGSGIGSANNAAAQADLAEKIASGQALPGINAAGQARGGRTVRGGMSWVGERGRELLYLPAGARVIPTVAPARVAPLSDQDIGEVAPIAAAGGLMGPKEIRVPVYLDRRQIAEAVGTYADDRAARR